MAKMTAQYALYTGALKIFSAACGVTTDPADPAMRGARGPWGPKNYGIIFFSLKISESKCGRALR